MSVTKNKRISVVFIFAALLLSGYDLFSGGSQDGAGRAYRIDFSGLGNISRNDLEEAARRELNAFNDESGSPADIADAAFSMELYLRQEGFAEADVQFSFFRLEEGDRKVYMSSLRTWEEAEGIEFIVTPGIAYRVRNIDFSGNTAYDSDFLRTFFTFRRPGFFGTDEPIFTEKDFSSGIGGIEELYLLDGYYAVDILTPDPVLSDEGYTDLRVVIREGRKYVLGDQDITSPDLNADQIQVLKAYLPQTGDPFYVRRAAEGSTELRNTLGDWGYDAQVDYEVALLEVSESEGLASILYTVTAGAPLVFSEYKIVNESDQPLRTSESLITSRFTFEPGDTLDRQRFNLGLSRLYSLGIFNTIDLRIVPKETEEGPLTPADIEIHVTESENRFVEATAGWGTWELFRGSLRYSDLNLFGTGRAWNVNVSGNFRGYGVETSLQDRVLLGPTSLLALSALYRYGVEPSFTVTEGNATASIGFELGPYLQLTTSYTYSLSQAVNRTTGVPSVEDELLSTGRLNFQAEYDTRNSGLLPERGYRAAAGITYSSRFLGSEREFLHYTLRGEAYLPLIDFAVLALEGDLETKQILDGLPSLPIQERLFLGGDDSVRSFSRNTLGPFGSEGDPLGGLTALQLTAELRLRIWRELHLALFYDMGILSQRFFTFDETFGHGIGAGLRYYLPVGPVRLDAAWNPGNLYADSNRWEIHFAVGFSF